MKYNDIIDELSDSEAKIILRKLANEDEKTAKTISALAEKLIERVDLSQISDSVFRDLDNLDVDVLWNNSGKTRYGYVDPGDEAYDMIERVLDEYIAEYDKYIRLNKRRIAMEYMIGIIKGIKKFDNEGISEFRDWAEDVGYCFVRDYIEKFKNNEGNAEFIDEFLQRLDESETEEQEIFENL